MYTSQASISQFMYTSLGWIGHLMFPSHVFHSKQPTNKVKKQGIAATCRRKRHWVLRALWMRTYNTAPCTATGKQAGKDITYTHHTLSALSDACQCNMRGERHESKHKSRGKWGGFLWKMQRGDVKIPQIIIKVENNDASMGVEGAAIPYVVENPSPHESLVALSYTLDNLQPS